MYTTCFILYTSYLNTCAYNTMDKGIWDEKRHWMSYLYIICYRTICICTYLVYVHVIACTNIKVICSISQHGLLKSSPCMYCQYSVWHAWSFIQHQCLYVCWQALLILESRPFFYSPELIYPRALTLCITHVNHWLLLT